MNSVIKITLIIALLISPLLNIGEIYTLLIGTLKGQTILHTPIYIKSMKDILMIFLILLFAVKFFFKKINISYVILVLLFILIVIINITSSVLIYGNDNFIIYGLRWIYPLLIFVLGIKLFNERFLGKSFERAFILVFLVHIYLQIYQFFSGIGWFGVIGDYSARNPGMFLIPNSGAFFSIDPCRQ